MKTYLKVVFVTLAALLIALIASRYVQLSSAPTLRQYELKYQELSHKSAVTEAERRELETLFRELNSAKNIKADLIGFGVKYSTLFLVLVPLTLYAAKWLRLEEGPMFATSGLIFLAFILSGLMVVGAIIGTLFFMASVAASKRGSAAGAGNRPSIE